MSISLTTTPTYKKIPAYCQANANAHFRAYIHAIATNASQEFIYREFIAFNSYIEALVDLGVLEVEDHNDLVDFCIKVENEIRKGGDTE